MLFSTFPTNKSVGEGANLGKTSWAEISAIARSGNASKYFSIGDRKSITIDGTIYCARIIDFNHDDLTHAELYGTATNGKAGITFDVKELWPTTVAYYSPGVLNDESYKVSWGGASGYESTLRSTVMPTIEAALPADLQSVIVYVNKLYRYYTAATFSSKIATSIDRLFVMNPVELGLDTGSWEKEEGTVYSFFDTYKNRTTTYCRGPAEDGTSTKDHLCDYWTRGVMATTVSTSDDTMVNRPKCVHFAGYYSPSIVGTQAFDTSTKIYTNFSFCV